MKLSDKVRELHKFMRSDEWADAVSSIFDDIEELEARVAGESFINRTLSAEVSRLKERVNNVEALEVTLAQARQALAAQGRDVATETAYWANLGELEKAVEREQRYKARIKDLEFLMEQQTLGHAEVVKTLETERDEHEQNSRRFEAERDVAFALQDEICKDRDGWRARYETSYRQTFDRAEMDTAIRNAKIGAYEDAKMVCDSSDTLTIRTLQARIDALKAGEDK